MRILPLIWFAELALVNARVLKHHQVGVEDTVPNLSLVNPAESRLTPVLSTQAVSLFFSGNEAKAQYRSSRCIAPTHPYRPAHC
jgi:hypothetical protein